MRTAEIRQRWLDYFEGNGHAVVPSASLVSPDPSTAVHHRRHGAVHPVHAGQQTPPWPRATSVQKCVRTARHRGGRQDHPARHVLPDERQLLVRRLLQGRRDHLRLGAGHRLAEQGGFGFDPDTLWVTVFHDDDEAAGSGATIVGLPDERIQRRGRKDNFWSTGAARPRAARARRSSSTAAPSTARRAARRSTRTATSRSGTSSSCSTSAARGGKEDFRDPRRAQAEEHRHRHGPRARRVSLQGVDNMYEIDEVFPVIAGRQELSGKRLRRRPAPTTTCACASSPTTSAPPLMLIGDGVHALQRGPRLRAAPPAPPLDPRACACSASRTVAARAAARSSRTR